MLSQGLVEEVKPLRVLNRRVAAANGAKMLARVLANDPESVGGLSRLSVPGVRQPLFDNLPVKTGEPDSFGARRCLVHNDTQPVPRRPSREHGRYAAVGAVQGSATKGAGS